MVTGLPFSAAFRVVFAFNQTVAAFCPALVGGLARLGGLPKAMVSDSDACIVASRRGGAVRLVDEVAGLYGQLGLKPVPLRPYFPQGKGYIERMNRFLETSFLPLRRFDSIADLQAQADQWAVEVAHRRRVRRIDAVVADALAVERGWLRAVPARWPDVDQRLEVRGAGPGDLRLQAAGKKPPAAGDQDPRRLRLQLPNARSASRCCTWPSWTSCSKPTTWCSSARPAPGKTHLSIALAVQAARRGHRVAFATAHQWVQRLDGAQRAGRLDQELDRLRRIPLLICDEVGYIPFEPEAAALFYALVASRYERASLIVSSNKPFSAWTEIFGDAVAVAAMVDRLVHHAEIISLKGDSYHLKDGRK